jgi:RNA polymerase sigma factor (sigma-70 family)
MHVAGALRGEAASIHALLAALQSPMYRLSLRMLGQPADAEDAAQEILLRVLTRLSTFRGESAFSTWVHAIAAHYLKDILRARKRAGAASFDDIGEALDRALAAAPPGDSAPTPEDRMLEREVALACTQGMLMALDVDQRLAYLLAEVFDLSGEEAAAVLSITPAAFRQRLGRARSALQAFVAQRCGLYDPDAPCSCSRIAAVAARRGGGGTRMFSALPTETNATAHAEWARLSRLARLFRDNPRYRAPDTLTSALRSAISTTVFAHPSGRNAESGTGRNAKKQSADRPPRSPSG